MLLPKPLENVRQELVRGQVIEMQPGGFHGVTYSKVGRCIGNFVGDHGLGTVASNSTGFITQRDLDSVRVPDIAYWSKRRLAKIPVGVILVPPELAVEVLSPSNTRRQIPERIAEYFACGVSVVWVVAPEDRTVTIYRTPDQGLLLHDHKGVLVSGDDVLPGLDCRVADLVP